MARIIQDSDDECEEGFDENAASPLPAQDASSPHLVPEPANTGSTESLKRAIQAAHHDVSQSEVPSVPSLPTPPSGLLSLSQQEQFRMKRIKSADFAHAAGFPNVKSQATQPLKTYGSTTSLGTAPFLPSTRNQEGKDDARLREWQLEGTIRQDYAHHEPMAMFPEPSSTVPNTTLTQERLLEEVLAPGFGIMPEDEPEAEPTMPRYEPQKSSIPWSDYLKSSSEMRHAQSQQESPGKRLSSPAQNGSRVDQNLDSLQDDSVLSVGKVPGSTRSNDVGAVNDAGMRTSVGIVREEEPPFQQPDYEARRTAALSAENAEIVHPNQGHSPSKQSLPEPPRGEAKEDTVPEEPPRKKRRKSPAATSEDELEYLGLPKEQYKPRPSRSRSLKSPPVQPIDWSVRPEKAARRGARRGRRTESDPIPSTPDKIKQICDMGFTPSTTQRALESNGGDVNQTVEWLINNAQDELAPPATQKRKSSVKKKSAKESAKSSRATQSQDDVALQNGGVPANTSTVADEKCPGSPQTASHVPISETLIETTKLESPVKVQVVIPRATEPSPTMGSGTDPSIKEETKENDSGFGDKAQGEPTMKNKTETSANGKSNASATTEQPKKRRGRPRKVPIEPPPVTVQTESPEEVVPDAIQSQEELRAPAIDDHVKHQSPPARDDSLPLAKPVLPATSTEVSTDKKTPEPQTKHESSTPLSKGKVSYRVGLSKRARIAPLLRVVRK